MKLSEMTVEGFLAELRSESPAPGGGTVAALAGAVAASLCSMVGALTLGRDRHRDSWDVMEKAMARADSLGARLRELMDEDTAAFNSVVAARRLPQSTEAEKASRDRAIQEGTLRSARVPLETLAALASLADLAALAAEKGNPGCITDAGSAAQMIKAGAIAAAWNVRVNLPSLTDTDLRARLEGDTSRILRELVEKITHVESFVESRLGDRS